MNQWIPNFYGLPLVPYLLWLCFLLVGCYAVLSIGLTFWKVNKKCRALRLHACKQGVLGIDYGRKRKRA